MFCYQNSSLEVADTKTVSLSLDGSRSSITTLIKRPKYQSLKIALVALCVCSLWWCCILTLNQVLEANLGQYPAQECFVCTVMLWHQLAITPTSSTHHQHLTFDVLDKLELEVINKWAYLDLTVKLSSLKGKWIGKKGKQQGVAL